MILRDRLRCVNKLCPDEKSGAKANIELIGDQRTVDAYDFYIIGQKYKCLTCGKSQDFAISVDKDLMKREPGNKTH